MTGDYCLRSSHSMKRPHRLLPLALLAATLAAGAAQPLPPGPTYRIVGPDGKVTFSDRQAHRPAAEDARARQDLTAPLLSSGSEPFDLHPSTTMPPPPGRRGGMTPAVDVGGRPFPPGLPDAVLDVLVHQFFVQIAGGDLRPPAARRSPNATRAACATGATATPTSSAKSNRITFARFTGRAARHDPRLGPRASRSSAARPGQQRRGQGAVVRPHEQRPRAPAVRARGRHARRADPVLRPALRRAASGAAFPACAAGSPDAAPACARALRPLPPSAMSTTEAFLLAITLVFAIPYLVWRLVNGLLCPAGRRPDRRGRDDWARRLGEACHAWQVVFNPAVGKRLGGVSIWGVMVFVLIAGVELDLRKAWPHRRESSDRRPCARHAVAVGLSRRRACLRRPDWIGSSAPTGNSCRRRHGLRRDRAADPDPADGKAGNPAPADGQRILRYASLDDIAIWGVLALILLDWERVGRQAGFLVVFAVVPGCSGA